MGEGLGQLPGRAGQSMRLAPRVQSQESLSFCISQGNTSFVTTIWSQEPVLCISVSVESDTVCIAWYCNTIWWDTSEHNARCSTLTWPQSLVSFVHVNASPTLKRSTCVHSPNAMHIHVVQVKPANIPKANLQWCTTLCKLPYLALS